MIPGFSFGQSSSRSSSEQRTFVDQSQQPFLDFMRNFAQRQAIEALPQQQALQGTAQQLFGQGQGFLGNLQGIGSPAMQQMQMQQLAGNLGQQFQQQVLPNIGRGAQMVGGLGGSRQGVAEGIAAQGFGQALTSGFTDIMSNAQQQRMQASLGGLSQLGGLMGIAGSPLTAQFNPLMQFASILGAPTVLSEGSSMSKSSSFNLGVG